MAGGREIVTKIRSVENTKKVTSALEMVSASKIRKSQDLMKESRPYARMMHRVIGHLLGVLHTADFCDNLSSTCHIRLLRHDPLITNCPWL